VGVDSLTFSYTPGGMKSDFRASLLARTFVSLCLGCEPKGRVVDTINGFPKGVGSINNVEKNLRKNEDEDNCMLCVQDEEKNMMLLFMYYKQKHFSKLRVNDHQI